MMTIRLKVVNGSFIHLRRASYNGKSLYKEKRDICKKHGEFISLFIPQIKQAGWDHTDFTG